MSRLFVELPPIETYKHAAAVGLNRYGHIAGTSWLSVGQVQQMRATVWYESHQRYVAEAVGPANTAAWQINDIGDVLLAHFKPSNLTLKDQKPVGSSIRRRGSAAPFDLSGIIPDGAIITGINNRGEFVGRHIKGTTTISFRGDLAGRFEELPRLTSSGQSFGIRPSGIDDSGRIAGCEILQMPNVTAAKVFWLPDGGNIWQDIQLVAARFQTARRETKGEVCLALEGQFVRITSQGKILASRLDSSGNSFAYYLDLDHLPVAPSQAPAGSNTVNSPPLAVRIPRAHPAAPNTLEWSRVWDAVSPIWWVGEESSGEAGNSTLYVERNGYHLKSFFRATRDEPGFGDLIAEFRAIAVNAAGLIVVNGSFGFVESGDTINEEPTFDLERYHRPYLISVPDILSSHQFGGSAATWTGLANRSDDLSAARRDVLLALQLSSMLGDIADPSARRRLGKSAKLFLGTAIRRLRQRERVTLERAKRSDDGTKKQGAKSKARKSSGRS